MYYIANARMPSERAHGIQIAKMCEAFVEAGIDLTLVTPQRAGSADSLKEFYGLRPTVSVRRLPVIDLYHNGKMGYRIASVSFALSALIFLLWKRILRERSFAYTIDMDQFSFLPLSLSGVPYFFESHGIKKPRTLTRFFVHRARGIIVINEYIRKRFLDSFRIEESKIIARPNGIDTDALGAVSSRPVARRNLSISPNAHVVVYVGKFYAWKGLDILAEAARQLGRETIVYAVGGDIAEFRRITGISDVPENLVCAGERPYREIVEWLGAADVLLLLGTAANDYSFRQTSPMKLFEYLVSHRPIVASETPAIAELVSTSEVYYYEPDNPNDLVRALKEAMFDGESAQKERMSRALQLGLRHTWRNRAAGILAFIESRGVMIRQ